MRHASGLEEQWYWVFRQHHMALYPEKDFGRRGLQRMTQVHTVRSFFSIGIEL